jgi:hypothetical protein
LQDLDTPLLPAEYFLEKFQKNQFLEKLASEPFILKILVTVLPYFSQESQIFKYAIYERFITIWVENEIKRISDFEAKQILVQVTAVIPNLSLKNFKAILARVHEFCQLVSAE